GFDPSAGVFLDSGLRDGLRFNRLGFSPKSPEIGLKFVLDKGPQMISADTGRSEQEMYDYLNEMNALRPGVDSFNQWKSLGSGIPQNDFVAVYDYAIKEDHPEELLDTWRHEYRHRGLDDPRLLQRLPTNFQKKLGDREEALVRMYDQHFGDEKAKRDAEKWFEKYENPYLSQQSLGSMLDDIEDAAGAINKRDTLPKDWFTALFD
ncbi:MAG: hypothetical protein VW443_00550, partial [Pseudomonadales bacterium]